jgi:hypothetical protein
MHTCVLNPLHESVVFRLLLILCMWQALGSRDNLPAEAIAAGADAAVEVKWQLGCDEYQQAKHDGGITTCSVKNGFNKRVCALAAHVGGDHQQSQKINLATDPSDSVKAVYKQVQELSDRGHVLVDALPDAPIWGEVKRLYVKLATLIVADWPAMLAMAGLGMPPVPLFIVTASVHAN